MTVTIAVILIASLLGIGAMMRPLARWLRVPDSILLAAGGLVLGALSLQSTIYPGAILPEAFSEQILSLSVGSSLFLFVLLPTLIFQGSLGVDIHRIRQDLLPILILALVAVVVATFGIALAIWPLAGVPLVVCLLLASLIATTDPVAVIGIFRDVGAPERLTRLVEGESLFNDAAAISLFLIFTTALVAPGSLTMVSAAMSLVLLPLGGAVLGFCVSLAFLYLATWLDDDRVSIVSLSLTIPFLAYWTAEEVFAVSGVIAVVSAGVTLASLTPGRISERTMRHLTDTWAQLASFAAILIFVLTSLQVPDLVYGATLYDVGLLAVVFIAALAARAVVMFGLFPLLARLGVTEGISKSYSLVILWGGLRGSMTLALALAITENPAIPRPYAAFIAILATGFTLLTLFVQGTTLRPLIQRLGLNTLSAIDRAIRDLAIRATSEKVEALSRAVTLRFRRAETAGNPAFVGADESIGDTSSDPQSASLSIDDRAMLALINMTAQQRELVLTQFGEGKVTPVVARQLLSETRRRLDRIRSEGFAGYERANEDDIAFGQFDTLCLRWQRRTGHSRPLSSRMADRFERLVALLLVLDRLGPYARAEMQPLVGREATARALSLLEARQSLVEREIAAIRLQYPRYVDQLETWTILRTAKAFAEEEFARLQQSGVINSEVMRDLLEDIEKRKTKLFSRPQLDLELDTTRLMTRSELFAPLSEAEKSDLARFLRPYFAAPGMTIIRKGERGDAAYFIASGAVEVTTATGRLQLGSGAILGEMAVLLAIPRQADVHAIAYSTLLRLSAADFAAFLQRHPHLRATVEALARARLAENQAASEA